MSYAINKQLYTADFNHYCQGCSGGQTHVNVIHEPLLKITHIFKDVYATQFISFSKLTYSLLGD